MKFWRNFPRMQRIKMANCRRNEFFAVVMPALNCGQFPHILTETMTYTANMAWRKYEQNFPLHKQNREQAIKAGYWCEKFVVTPVSKKSKYPLPKLKKPQGV